MVIILLPKFRIPSTTSILFSIFVVKFYISLDIGSGIEPCKEEAGVKPQFNYSNNIKWPLGAAAIAQWIHLLLPSFSSCLNPKHTINVFNDLFDRCYYLFFLICHWIVQMNRNSKKWNLANLKRLHYLLDNNHNDIMKSTIEKVTVKTKKSTQRQFLFWKNVARRRQFPFNQSVSVRSENAYRENDLLGSR